MKQTGFAAILLSSLISFLIFGAAARAQDMAGFGEPLLKDSFTGGKPELQWQPYPHFNLDNLRGETDPTAPESDGGVGVLDNKTAGGFAALSYVATPPPADFYLEAWLHAQVSPGDKGPLNGFAFRIDAEGGNFYRVATHFMAQPEISLAFVGKETNHFPKYLARWTGAAIPGGPPATSKWHKLAIAVKDDQAEVYWNDTKLPDGPFPIDRVRSGFIGVYANFVGGLGLADTRVDGLRVWSRK